MRRPSAIKKPVHDLGGFHHPLSINPLGESAPDGK
jgi:hypothetical protein